MKKGTLSRIKDCDPTEHHDFVLRVEKPDEPRATIVREMAKAWHRRNILIARYDDKLELRVEERQAALEAIRRIWRAARGDI
jgi:hypothetical protein